jgi:hypothetical protein
MTGKKRKREEDESGKQAALKALPFFVVPKNSKNNEKTRMKPESKIPASLL